MILGGDGYPAPSDGMSSLVMLRWIVPVRAWQGSSRELIRTVVSPAVRGSGWLSSPGTTHHASDRGDDVWVTVITRVDDVTDLREELAGLLRAEPTIETGNDPLLTPFASWYRLALHGVSQVSFDVVEAAGDIPLSEYQAFESPTEAAVLLVRYLNEVSDTYRRACCTYEKTESFWLSFFRSGPGPGYRQPGRSLWNLAG